MEVFLLLKLVLVFSFILTSDCSVKLRNVILNILPAGEERLRLSLTMNSRYIIIAGSKDGGSLLPYTYNGTTLHTSSNVFPRGLLSRDYFGTSVRVNNNNYIISGDYMGCEQMGCAYVGLYNGSVWDYEKIMADDGEVQSYFGYSVDVNNDNIVAVGAPYSNEKKGAVYIFHYYDSQWIQKQKIIDSSINSYSRFGERISLGKNRLLVGAPNADYDNLTGPGLVYVYEKHINGTWMLGRKLKSPNAVARGRFGISIGMQGNFIYVGADGENAYKGRVYVYRYDGDNTNGDNINLNTILEPVDLLTGNQFGWTLSVYQGTLVAGTARAGTAYVYKLKNGVWTLTDKLIGLNSFEETKVGIYNETVAVVQVDGLRVFTIATHDTKDSNGGSQTSSSPYSFITYSTLYLILYIVTNIML